MTLFMKFLHIVTAMWFISGLIGRTVSMWQAAKSPDVQTVKTLVRLAGYFENLMVIPGSLTVLGFGLIVAWFQGWPLLGFLQGSTANWLLVSTLLYLSLIPVVMLVFLPRGKIFGEALATALNQGMVTPALTTAFHDRAVAAAHGYEWIVTIMVTFLMVNKPF